MKKVRIKIHFLFLIMVLMAGLLRREWVFGWIYGGLFFGECAKGMMILSKRGEIQKILFTPLGIRFDWKERIALSLREQVWMHSIGSVGLMLGATGLFAMEMRIEAGIWVLCSVFRLLPVLPLDGGRIVVLFLGRRYGTLRTASVMTKIGRGIGQGCILFGIGYAILFPFEIWMILIGCYLRYTNHYEFHYTARRLYEQLFLRPETLETTEIFVSGYESPAELVERLHPFSKTLFSLDMGESVSQERVLVGFFNAKDASWLWRRGKRNSCKSRSFRL